MTVQPASGPGTFGPPVGVLFCFRRRVRPRVPRLPERNCAVCTGTPYMRLFGGVKQPRRCQGIDPGFLLSLFDRKALDQVTPLKGKFRSFLLAALKNYLSVEFHRENTIKRGGTFEFVPLDFESGDDRYSYVPSDALTPEKVFDARWAMTLLV